jgi:hypothetical protein
MEFLKESYTGIFNTTKKAETERILKVPQNQSLVKEFWVSKDKDIEVTEVTTKFGYLFKSIENNSKECAKFSDKVEKQDELIKAGESKLFVLKF